MKRHSMFDEVPAGLRFYWTGNFSNCEGVWVPIPVYWILCIWRDLRIAYLCKNLRRKHGRSKARNIIVCLKCGQHNEDDPEFYDPLRCWKCGNELERER
jgi:hypothetical protein